MPYADVGPVKVPAGLSDEQVLFLSDIFPTGYMAAEFCDPKPGDTIAIWGCGPVGQFAIRSAFLLGAVLERFFARLVGFNSFTETVLKTPQRGEIMRWPARLGQRSIV